MRTRYIVNCTKSSSILLLIALLAVTTAVAQQPEYNSNILIVGGGTHHNFDRWFNLEDSKILAEIGAETRYTEYPEHIQEVLPEIDILYLSNNQSLPEPVLRQSIFDFVDS